MTAQLLKSKHPAEYAEMSPLMQAALAALGGPKHWTGRVRGLGGLIRRTFIIDSTGHYENGQLKFCETMKFDDGDTNQREWTIIERSDGLHIEADSVELIRPGRLERNALSFIYRLKLGRFAMPYRDVFKPGTNAEVENTGFATMLGLPIMKIEAVGQNSRPT